MKRFVSLLLLLILTSLACQLTQPAAQLTETAPASTSAPEATPTYTPTLRPTPKPITCTDDSCLDACLSRIDGALTTQTFDPLSETYAGSEANLNLTDYSVTDGVLGEPDDRFIPADFRIYQQDREAHLRVWNYISGLLSPNEMRWIDRFTVFTDGPRNYLAWVSLGNDENRSNWTLAVDMLDSQDPLYLTYTLAHELGHLLTLNTDQVPATDLYYGWYQNSASCENFTSPEGCNNADSYMNLFYQEFWKDIHEEWLEDVELIVVNSPDERRALVSKFHDKRADEFVREYAATNIHEDLAESFMHFLLDPKPTGKSIEDQKIRFYYDFPEMVSLRQSFIQGVCSYVQE